MRLRCVTATVFASIALTVSAAPRSGSISGRVVGPAGAPVAHARVTITGSDATMTTGESGRFAFPHLAPGHYDVSAEADGFTPARKRVDVKANTDVAVELQLGMLRSAAAQCAGPGEDCRNRRCCDPDKVCKRTRHGSLARCVHP